VNYLVAEHQLSVRQSCHCVGLSRSAFYTPPESRDDAEVVDAINTIIDRHPRWGFWKTFKALRRKGYEWNHKRVYRVYCSLKLNQKRRAKKRLPQRFKQPLFVPPLPNQVWSADFMSDMLYTGKRFRRPSRVQAEKPSHPGGLTEQSSDGVTAARGKQHRCKAES